MPNNQISVGDAVEYQLHEDDRECNQGSGKVTQIVGDVAAIKPTNGSSGLDEVHRVIVNDRLMIKKP